MSAHPHRCLIMYPASRVGTDTRQADGRAQPGKTIRATAAAAGRFRRRPADRRRRPHSHFSRAAQFRRARQAVMLVGLGSHFEIWNSEAWSSNSRTSSRSATSCCRRVWRTSVCERALRESPRRSAGAGGSGAQSSCGRHLRRRDTFGRGGHSRAILAQLGASGSLIALDRDPEAIAAARDITDRRFVAVHAAFADLNRVLVELRVTPGRRHLAGPGRVVAAARRRRSGIQFQVRCAAGHAHGYHSRRLGCRVAGGGKRSRHFDGAQGLWRRTVC